MYKQYLPTYKHDFEDYIRWQTKETDHYVFHYFKNSEAEKDIKRIKLTQEKAYKKILEFLELPAPKKKIEYFFYPNETIKKKLMGDSWYAQAIYKEFRVHVLYTKKEKPAGPHEDTHLLSLPLGLPTGFLQEGLAEYITGRAWDGRRHDYYVKDGYSKKLFPPLAKLLSHKYWMKTDESNAIYFYSLAGAFSAYLIKNFGKKKFISFYRKTDRWQSQIKNAFVFEKIYHFSINEIENKLKTVKIRP